MVLRNKLLLSSTDSQKIMLYQRFNDLVSLLFYRNWPMLFCGTK